MAIASAPSFWPNSQQQKDALLIKEFQEAKNRVMSVKMTGNLSSTYAILVFLLL